MKQILVLMVFLLLGCKSTKYIEVPIETIKTEYKTDSIFIHDSDINIDSVYQKDSTITIIKDSLVYTDRWHTEYKYKYIENTDTIYKDKYIAKTDSVDRPVYITKEVEVNKLYTWLKILMWMGGAVLLSIFGYFGYKLFLKYVKK